MAKLLIHPLIETRIEAVEEELKVLILSKNHPDVLWMTEEKLGVEQAKLIRQFLSLKPYSAKGRVVVVLNAQNFTNDAQNSLLKTLEEPPVDATILLTADSDKKILPTVLSRCEIITIETPHVILSNLSEGSQDSKPRDSSASPQNDIKRLQQLSIEERFEFIEKLEDKDEFLQALVEYFHNQLTTSHNPRATHFLKDLLHAEAWKEANGNIRAILEYLMLKMPGL